MIAEVLTDEEIQYLMDEPQEDWEDLEPFSGECPYCGRPFDSFGIRDPRSVTCPRCGAKVTSGICSCGTVMPDSRGRFPCICGEELRITADRCPNCGRTFEKVVCSAEKRFIPRDGGHAP